MHLRDAIQDLSLECKVRRLVSRTIDNYGKHLRYLTNYLAEECQLEKLEDDNKDVYGELDNRGIKYGETNAIRLISLTGGGGVAGQILIVTLRADYGAVVTAELQRRQIQLGARFCAGPLQIPAEEGVR